MLQRHSEDSMAYGTWIENPNRGRILIVDDQAENIQLLECLLQDAGFENITSTTDAGAVVCFVPGGESGPNHVGSPHAGA